MSLSHTKMYKDIGKFGSDIHSGLAIGINEEQTVPVNVDTASPIFMVTKPIFKSRSKHIKINYHFIREKAEKRKINIFYVPNEKLMAAALTKSMPAEVFAKHVMHMGVLKDCVA